MKNIFTPEENALIEELQYIAKRRKTIMAELLKTRSKGSIAIRIFRARHKDEK